MQVKLFKKTSSYKDKNTQEEKQATNFFVDCNGKLIPVAVKYFENEQGVDTAYNGRKAVLSAFADELPERENSEKSSNAVKSIAEAKKND